MNAPGPAGTPVPGPPPGAPLEGLVVVDLTRVLAGPYCTMVLADLGARVIKVERPDGGDDARGFGPFAPDGRSAYFASVNRNKESIALDLKAPADRAVFERLLGRADVLVENYRPGTMATLGYDWASLHARWPRLVVAAVSGFGHTGPYARRPAYDMVVQAMGGLMSITGQPGGEPTRVGTSIGDITAALFATVGILTALRTRDAGGEGTFVDVAMLDCQVAILENAIARYVATGTVPAPLGARHPTITPFGAFRAADGHVVIAAGNDALFAALADCLGVGHLVGDPRFATNAARTEHEPTLKAALEEALGSHATAHWLATLEAAGVPVAPINDVGAVLADPHVQARTMVVSAPDPSFGRLRMAGNPVKLWGRPDPAERRAAPGLDADRAAVLAWLDRG